MEDLRTIRQSCTTKGWMPHQRAGTCLEPLDHLGWKLSRWNYHNSSSSLRGKSYPVENVPSDWYDASLGNVFVQVMCFRIRAGNHKFKWKHLKSSLHTRVSDSSPNSVTAAPEATNDLLSQPAGACAVMGEAFGGGGIQKHEHMLTCTDMQADARLGPDIYKHTGTRVYI